MRDTYDVEPGPREQRRVLRWLLAVNAALFVLELAVGLAAESAALVADSLDTFADATVFAVGLLAVTSSASGKLRAARLSGALQVALALVALAEVVRRAALGSEPEPIPMLAVGAAVLAVNAVCLGLIAGHRFGEVHMRAAYAFAANDVVTNLAVVAGGGLVLLLGTRVPDLVVGACIALFVLHGGLRILRGSRAP